MKKLVFFFAVITFFSCRKEDKEIISYDEFSAIIKPGEQFVSIQKAGNLSEVPAALLPKIRIKETSILTETRLETRFLSISGDELPEGKVNIADDNFLWNFSFAPVLHDSIELFIPYSSNLEKRLLKGYVKLFKIYSCKKDLSDWRLENQAENDTINFIFRITSKENDRYYGVFFDEVLSISSVVIDIDLVNQDSSWHHYLPQNNYFMIVPEDFIDNKYFGCYMQKDTCYFNIWGISYDYTRLMVKFVPKGIGLYQSNEFEVQNSSALYITGSWQTNFYKTSQMTLEVYKWGGIGELIEFKIKGIMNEEDLGDAETEIYVKTIRSR